MLREKILRKIYFTFLIVFVLFIISSFTINKSISNIKVEYQSKTSNIYLMDDNNYLLKVSIPVKKDLIDNIFIVISNLKQTNHYSGLKGVIPGNTKLKNVNLDNNILFLDFDREFLNINEKLLEKEIESIVYSMLDFNDIKGVSITIDSKPLKNFTNIVDTDILTKNIGINKEYNITSTKDIQRVVLYYYEEKDNNKYYVPVTKYVNSKEDKIKIIIDNLKNSYLVKTNLMSYLNDKVKIEKYEKDNDIVTISFAQVVDFNMDESMEEVIYTISESIIESNIAEKVIFLQNNHILSVK